MFTVVLLFSKPNWEWVQREALEKIKKTTKRKMYYFSLLVAPWAANFVYPSCCCIKSKAKNVGELLRFLSCVPCSLGVYVNTRLILTYISVNSWKQKAHWTAKASGQRRNHSEINLGIKWGQPTTSVSENTEEKLGVNMVPCEWSWKLEEGGEVARSRK